MVGLKDVQSYRGYYEHLMVRVVPNRAGVTELDVDTLLKQLKQHREEGWCGYKGGHFTADADTRVFIDEYGECAGDIVVSDNKVVLETIKVEH